MLRRYLDHKGLEVEWDAARQAPAGALVNSLAMGLPLDPAGKAGAAGGRRRWPSARRVLAALLEIDAAGDDDEPPPLQ